MGGVDLDGALMHLIRLCLGNHLKQPRLDAPAALGSKIRDHTRRALAAVRLRLKKRRALAAMKRCRNQASLKMQVRCDDCEHQVYVPHSCGNRHCPHCQHHESEQWLARQRARQLPAQYFLLTLTLPAESRPLWQSHQSVLYDLLMRAAWDKVLVYLGRYLYRGVIAENNIVAVSDGQVSFQYQNAKTRFARLHALLS